MPDWKFGPSPRKLLDSVGADVQGVLQAATEAMIAALAFDDRQLRQRMNAYRATVVVLIDPGSELTDKSSASGNDSSGDSGQEEWMRSGLNADSPRRPVPPPAFPRRTAPPYDDEWSLDGARSRRSRRAATVVALLLLVALLTIFVLILN